MPPELREALLDEFERSGMTGQVFAQRAGVNYTNLANWENGVRKNGVNQTDPDGLIWERIIGRPPTPNPVIAPAVGAARIGPVLTAIAAEQAARRAYEKCLINRPECDPECARARAYWQNMQNGLRNYL
jgi:transcriptional regulator with XRE-family HTH domain